MKHLIPLLSFLLATGCSLCQLSHPLDGKAQSWCERKEAAESFCRDESLDLGQVGYGFVTCKGIYIELNKSCEAGK